KVLPPRFGSGPLAQADDEAFARAPVGSGPFVFAGRFEADGRTYVRFTANPHYRGRATHGTPQGREVRFFVSRDPVADFAHKSAPLHLLLDVPTQELGQLKAAGVCEINTLPTRRVYFLAVNHRDGLLANQAVRRALAHAIDRPALLADHFGGGRPRF